MKRNQGIYTKRQAGSSSVTITRPANTTQYTAGDVFGPATTANLEFEDILQESAQHFYITDAKIEVVLASVPLNMSTFTLHLFNAAPTAIADNSAWTLLEADATKYIGKIVFTLPTDLGAVLITWENGLNLKRKLVTTSIYGQLVTDGNYTPTSGEVIKLQLETVGV